MMKKTLYWLTAFCLLLFLSPVVRASADAPYVTDLAGLLTEEECAQLEQWAASVSSKYQSGVYIVTIEDYTDYGYSPYEVAKSAYQQLDCGLGEDDSGTLLLLSIAERDYAFIARGDFANAAFTDYGKRQLEQEFLDNFSYDDWYGGFTDFIFACDEYMELAYNGTPVDTDGHGYEYSEPRQVTLADSIGLSALLSCFGAGTACMHMKRKMKSVRQKTQASSYLAPGAVKMRASYDQYLNTTVTRTPIQREKTGGGTTIDLSGFSGHSGKF